MTEHVSPRVNSARLHDYLGRTVRLTCKVIRIQNDTAIVEASDGGQVEVKLSRESRMTDTFIEVVGRVEDAGTVKMMACINMGSDLDMKLVNDCVELIHDPKYQNMFF